MRVVKEIKQQLKKDAHSLCRAVLNLFKTETQSRTDIFTAHQSSYANIIWDYQKFFRDQIKLRHKQQLAILKFKQKQEITRLHIIEQQKQYYAELHKQQQIGRAQAIIKSLINLGIIDFKKLNKSPNKIKIITDLTNYIISLPLCSIEMQKHKLLYIANILRGYFDQKKRLCHGQFAEYINHERLINLYFEQLGIRSVEERFVPTSSYYCAPAAVISRPAAVIVSQSTSPVTLLPNLLSSPSNSCHPMQAPSVTSSSSQGSTVSSLRSNVASSLCLAPLTVVSTVSSSSSRSSNDSGAVTHLPTLTR